MVNRKSVYVETTIPSLITARLSNNPIVSYRQLITKDFWDNKRHYYNLYVSRYVYEECGNGDKDAAERRLHLIKDIPYLPITEDVENLAEEYFSFLDIPLRAKTDCYHLAVCVVAKIDYLMSWNMTHLGGVSYNNVAEYNYKHNLWLPNMNTPDVITELEMEESK